MKKIVLIILAILIFVPANAFAAAKKSASTLITYETKDNFVIKSKLLYPKEQKASYPLVIMLHSLGYSSTYWTTVPQKFLDNGAAVLLIDLRGHGGSSYDTNFKIQSWIKYTDKQFARYPQDVVDVMTYVLTNYTNLNQHNYAVIGADIGANTAILATEKIKVKPRCLVLISASRNFKGLYTPISFTNSSMRPVLAIASQRDPYSMKELYELKKFSQNRYDVKTYPHGGTGMLMLKVNPTMSDDIVNWISSILMPEKK